MPKTIKIAISLPDNLLVGIERERIASGQTRSEFFRRAAEAFLRQKRERKAIERYVRGYLRHPETEEEIVFAEANAQQALAENPWEDGAR